MEQQPYRKLTWDELWGMVDAGKPITVWDADGRVASPERDEQRMRAYLENESPLVRKMAKRRRSRRQLMPDFSTS